MSRFPGKVNLVNLIKKKNRNLLVFKRVQVTSTNGEGNLTNNTNTTSNGSDFSHVKSESDLELSNSPSPLLPLSRQDVSLSSSSLDAGHEPVSTSEKTSNGHASHLNSDGSLNCNNPNDGKNDSNCIINSLSSTDNCKYDSLTRQDIRENILSSKEIKASTGLSFFQSLVNPTSASPDKSLDEDEDNEDEDKFTFEGFSQDEVDENRRRILQEYDLLSTDDSSSSSDSISGSNYTNCKSHLDDSTSNDSNDHHQFNDDEQHQPVKMSTSKPLQHSSTTDSLTTITTTTTSSSSTTTTTTNVTSNSYSFVPDVKGKISNSNLTLRSTSNASPTVSSSPGVKVTSKNRRSAGKYKHISFV